MRGATSCDEVRAAVSFLEQKHPRFSLDLGLGDPLFFLCMCMAVPMCVFKKRVDCSMSPDLLWRRLSRFRMIRRVAFCYRNKDTS